MKHNRVKNRVLKSSKGTVLVVQWLRLCTSIARGVGLIPGWGTKVPHAAAKKIKKIKC